MIFIGTLIGFGRGIWKALKDPEFRNLFFLILILLAAGTIFYSKAEKWSLFDSFFFSFTTLAMDGVGDPVPMTHIGRIFTIIYIILGISTMLALINKLAHNLFALKEEKKLKG